MSREANEEALEYEGQFNAIDPETGWKVDFILRKNRAFSESGFERRRTARVLGLDVVMASPEDLVIAKLEWAKKGASELQLRDVASVVRTHRNTLDEPYLLNWVRELEEQWEAALKKANQSDEGPSA